MHPVLLVPDLQGIEKQIYDVLARRGAGMSQTKIISALSLSASSQSSISRALSKLAARGLVEKSGTTRDAAFTLTPEARWFSVPGHLRRPVHYDAMRFKAYDPANQNWLAPEARALMAVSVGQGALDLDPPPIPGRSPSVS